MISSSQPELVPLNRVSSQSSDLFHQVFSYPFSTDRGFQQGLCAILNSASSPEEAETLTLNAQCFYYARKHALPPLNVDAYRTWLQSHPINDAVTPSVISQSLSSQEPTIMRNPSTQILDIDEPNDASVSNQAGAAAPAPYPTSFSQIVDLITNGQPIPGIKEVPDTILLGQESRAVTAKRKKPWERDDRDGDLDEVARIDALTSG